MVLEPSFEASLAEFVTFLHSKGKEDSTIKMYASEVRQFLKWTQDQGKKLSDITQEDLLTSRNDMFEKGMKFSTINKTISILSSFFKWARDRGYVSANPAEEVRLLEPKKDKPPRWLSDEEAEQLLRTAAKEKNPFKKARNEALIYVMLYAGLRVDEVSWLRLDSLQEDTLVVYDGDAESRRVPIQENVRQKMQVWLARRAEANKPLYEESPYLFVTERSGFMQTRSVQFVIEVYSFKAGLVVQGHHLRNTYCRKLAVQGVPLEQLKRWAGHKSVLTTWQYYSGLE